MRAEYNILWPEPILGGGGGKNSVGKQTKYHEDSHTNKTSKTYYSVGI